jgi:hypothetical protein
MSQWTDWELWCRIRADRGQLENVGGRGGCGRRNQPRKVVIPEQGILGEGGTDTWERAGPGGSEGEGAEGDRSVVARRSPVEWVVVESVDRGAGERVQLDLGGALAHPLSVGAVHLGRGGGPEGRGWMG